MIETYNFLRTTITRNWKEKTDEEICELYQRNNTNELLAYEYCKHFPLLRKITKKYGFFISEEELASYTLEYLDASMRKFDVERNGKFLTYAYTVIKNGIANQNRHYGCKDVIYRNTVSYDNEIENATSEGDSYIETLEDKSFNAFDRAVAEADVNRNLGLNKKEMKVCNLILSGLVENKLEIAEGMNRDRITIYNYTRNIKEKFEMNESYFGGGM